MLNCWSNDITMLKKRKKKSMKNMKYLKFTVTVFLLNLCLIFCYIAYTEGYKLPILPPLSIFTSRLSNPTEIKFLTNHMHNITRKYIQNYTSKINFNWLENNPVYKQFKIKPLPVRKKVTILVIVSSGPRRVDRRNAIRQTWWKQCKPTNKVIPECIFMTDHSPKASEHYNITNEEFRKYGDIRFQHVLSGVTFGLRMLNHMVFAVSHYDFDYFLRVDDDYFMCFQNFLDEIPLPPLYRFHWGWVHRVVNIRPEESMLLLSRDLIETFLLQDPNRIMCHPWADQMIGEWSNSLGLKDVWRHDERLWHNPPSRDSLILQMEKNICQKYIGLHGAYPKDMIRFWRHRGVYKKRDSDLEKNSVIVPIKGKYDWRSYIELWRYEPKLCILNYKWDTSKQSVLGGSYTGRQYSRNWTIWRVLSTLVDIAKIVKIKFFGLFF